MTWLIIIMVIITTISIAFSIVFAVGVGYLKRVCEDQIEVIAMLRGDHEVFELHVKEDEDA